MKNTVLILFLIFSKIFGVTFVDETQYAKNIVGSKNLKGAKFLGETIWQDEPINEEINFMSYKEAKRYCKNLKLLGLKGWRLPLKTDFMILDDEKEKLRYIAKGCDGFGYCSRRNEYYTLNQDKKGVYTIADLDNGKYPYIFTTKFPDTKRAVRCVLNPNIYNRFQLQKGEKLVKTNTLEGYLKAFLATKKKSYLKKALKLAKTREDKAKIEEALAEFLGFFKLFDVIANGEIIKDGKDYDSNNRLLAAMSKSKNLKYLFKIRPKAKAPLKLKYNSYKVTLEFNLKIKYSTVSLGIGMQKRKFLHVKRSFILSPKNRYSVSLDVDFGEIEQASKANLLIFSTSKKLESLSLTYEVDEFKVVK